MTPRWLGTTLAKMRRIYGATSRTTYQRPRNHEHKKYVDRLADGTKAMARLIIFFLITPRKKRTRLDTFPCLTSLSY